MQRFRFVALPMVLATALWLPRAAIAEVTSPVASMSGSPAVTALSRGWNLIRQWLGGTHVNCGPTIDPLGGCAGSPPHTAKPRVDCGPTADPLGGCAGSAPAAKPRVDCGPGGDPLGGCAGAVSPAMVLPAAAWPGRVAIAELTLPAASMNAWFPSTGIWQAWSVIRQWLGGNDANCGPTIDPTGGCAGSAPHKAVPGVQCGPTGDPTGGCAGASSPQGPAGRQPSQPASGRR
jgi:hypothetical protein